MCFNEALDVEVSLPSVVALLPPLVDVSPPSLPDWPRTTPSTAFPFDTAPCPWKMHIVMICHDEREEIVTYVSVCGVNAVK